MKLFRGLVVLGLVLSSILIMSTKSEAKWSGGNVVCLNNNITWSGNCSYNAVLGKVSAWTPPANQTDHKSSISITYKQTWTNVGNNDTLSLSLTSHISGSSDNPMCGSGARDDFGSSSASIYGNTSYVTDATWNSSANIAPISFDALFTVNAIAMGQADVTSSSDSKASFTKL